ncbi:hypothetical protein HY249_03170 [Candidatus Azambacteria bacterium]|nr:hypothetical protein [Candidatus Azambacteria bacterium]
METTMNKPEEKTGKECQCWGCRNLSHWGCKDHSGHYGHKFFAVRWILGIIILLAVFSLGVKIGEFKEYAYKAGGYGYGYDYGHNYMMNPYYNTCNGSGYMMPYGNDSRYQW